MKTLKEIGITVESNVRNNFIISSNDTHIEWNVDGKVSYEIRHTINLNMGIILAGYIQSLHFNYEGGGRDLYDLQKDFKSECFLFFQQADNLHSFSKVIGGETYTWKFTGEKTHSGNAIFKTEKI